jgi:hypothetical protein
VTCVLLELELIVRAQVEAGEAPHVPEAAEGVERRALVEVAEADAEDEAGLAVEAEAAYRAICEEVVRSKGHLHPLTTRLLGIEVLEVCPWGSEEQQQEGPGEQMEGAASNVEVEVGFVGEVVLLVVLEELHVQVPYICTGHTRHRPRRYRDLE